MEAQSTERGLAPRPEPGAAERGASALQLEGITKRFPGVLANDRISFEVERGEILGLLGENGAGKTTLMKIVYGLYQPDEGSIFVNGREVSIRSPQHAVELGIGMVHQHFMLVPDMTVAENVAMGPSKGPGRLDLRGVESRVEALCRQFGLDVDPCSTVEDLRLGARQRVEIVKLLYRGADLLILDEPTAALTPPEWHDLSLFLRSLADQGKAVIFITHKLEELFGLVDRCTVLRDGRVVGTVAIVETDKPSLARMMVGREVTLRVERPVSESGDVVLQVEGLTLEEDGRRLLDDIRFAIREREVFGIAGVGGNGQNELVEILVGLRSMTSGSIRLGGRPYDRPSPKRFMDLGGALIPEDRQREAIALELTLMENLLIKEYRSPTFSRNGILDSERAREHAQRLVTEYDVRTPGVTVPMRQLSGGNQQKAVLARELSREPSLVIAAQPTRGLDVGAMEFVYERLNERKTAGAAVLLISFELDEIFSMCDRFAVMVDGRFLRVLEAGSVDAETVGLLMGGEQVPS